MTDLGAVVGIVINSLVAGGTLVLAVVTWMAAATRQSVQVSQQMANLAQQQARAAQEQAAISKTAFLSSVEPLLAEVPLTTQPQTRERGSLSFFSDSIDSIYVVNDEKAHRLLIKVPCGNIGHGPAIITSACLRTVDGIDILAESLAVRIMRAGGITRANFVVTDLAYGMVQIPRKDEYPDLSVEFTYTNAYGIDTRISELDVKRQEVNGQYTIIGVHFRTPENCGHSAADQRSIGSPL